MVELPIRSAHAWKHSARVWGDGARAEHITAWVSTSGEVLTQLDEQAPHESVWKKLGRTLGQDEEWPEARGSTRDSRWGARPAMKRGRVFPIAENPEFVQPTFAAAVISSSRISQGLRDVEVLRVEMIPPTNGWNPEGLCVTWAGRALDACVGGTTCITERGKINQTRTSLRPYHGSVPDDCAEIALRDL